MLLSARGVTLDVARTETLRLLGSPSTDAPERRSRGLFRRRPPAQPRHPVSADRAAVPPPRADTAWFLKLDDTSGVPIFEQIIARIEEAVATGQLEPGERLPSVRDLSAELGIAPGTVARAYSELESRRVVLTEGARGTRVATSQPAANKSLGTHWLDRLLRRTVVAAYHKGASAQDLRDGLERAMKGILHVL
jgi:DNA-binding transcriptional regulator YhcF (GntR family)